MTRLVGICWKAPVRLVGHPKRACNERISSCQLRVEDSPKIKGMLKQSAKEIFCFILNPESKALNPAPFLQVHHGVLHLAKCLCPEELG